MKKIKTILTAIIVVAMVGCAFTFNAKRGSFRSDKEYDINCYTKIGFDRTAGSGSKFWYQDKWDGMTKCNQDTSKVRFTYNGAEVVYGIIISPTSGKKWLDRNLGAKRVATSVDDYQAYGDLFQWGRPADGHQLINRTSSTAGTAVNGVTTILATTDIPGHSNFIFAPIDGLVDWRSDNNRNRWVTAPQGPCPAGWHVPTLSEWLAEVPKSAWYQGTATSGGITDGYTAYNVLKLTISGFRNGFDDGNGGGVRHIGRSGYYWSSSDNKEDNPWSLANEFHFIGDGIQFGGASKADAYCVRCIIN